MFNKTAKVNKATEKAIHKTGIGLYSAAPANNVVCKIGGILESSPAES